LDELEEGLLWGEDLRIDLLEESEVSDQLFRKSRNGISKVSDAWEYVYGLVNRVGAGERLSGGETAGS
jgi:hypothetical protein